MTAPSKKFNSNNVTIAVWENEVVGKDKKKFTTQSLTIQKNYKDKDGKWQSTNNLKFDDLNYVILACYDALNFKYRREEPDEFDV